jgi:hypothetical protein
MCASSAACVAQVSVAEERHRGLKEALEVDIASIGGQADKIKVRGQAGCMHPCRFSAQQSCAWWPASMAAQLAAACGSLPGRVQCLCINRAGAATALTLFDSNHWAAAARHLCMA